MSSGKASRARRVQAVNEAKNAVYLAKANPDKITNPFKDERRSRIFDQYVVKWLSIYTKHEALCKELELAYGYQPRVNAHPIA